jgi:acetyl-CoA acetyltransferase
MPHPFRDVAIVGVYNTVQARELPGHDSASIELEGALGALADAGLSPRDVDTVCTQFSTEDVLALGLGPSTIRGMLPRITSVLDAAALIATGQSDVVLIAAGGAAVYTDRAATAPWTRPAHEFVVGYGLFTAAEFALIARRHMLTYGTTPEQMARVASTIRNNGHVNPKAVYYGRGPFTPEDILASRMVADPFHLLDCATTSEGACGLVLARADRVADTASTPAWILGGGGDSMGPSYHIAPRWDMRGSTHPDIPAGYVGRRAARRSYAMAGLSPSEVDVAEFYDPFSFEIIRQLEAFDFCGDGEGGPFVADGHIAAGGTLPITTDGGLMSFGHAGHAAQLLQRVIRAVEQVRGSCETMQVPGAEVAICSNGGAGALFTDVLLVGSEQP